MVLKRNLPSSVSSRLNPWEEATAPRSPATPDLDEGLRPKRQPGADRGMKQTLEYRLPDTEISDPALSWPNGPEREPRNLLEAVQAAARRRGVLPQESEPEFDYPMIDRTVKTLTTILGRHPKSLCMARKSGGLTALLAGARPNPRQPRRCLSESPVRRSIRQARRHWFLQACRGRLQAGPSQDGI